MQMEKTKTKDAIMLHITKFSGSDVPNYGPMSGCFCSNGSIFTGETVYETTILYIIDNLSVCVISYHIIYQSVSLCVCI